MVGRLIFIFFFLLRSLTANCQNLVLNGSFEDYNLCPDFYNQINHANGWFALDGMGGSSEYFNACNNPNSFGVPVNSFGNQPSRTGDGYAGSWFFDIHTEYCEYIEGTLSASLLSEECYTVVFYLSLADYCDPGIDAIGMYFTSDSLLFLSAPIEVVPQIQNDSLNIINDKVNWIRIQGSFTAIGGEMFLTIGRFKRNEFVNYDTLSPDLGGAYYYIDDVAVYPCYAPVYIANCGEDLCLKPGQSFTVGSHDLPEYEYYWFNEDSALIDTTAFLHSSVSESEVFYLMVRDFKFDVTWDTVHITVSDTCNKGLFYLPNIFSPNEDGQNDVLYVRGENISEIQLSMYNRWGNLLFETNEISIGWDGRYKGKDCPEEVYFYIAEVTFESGESVIKKGNVTIAR
jgi:gliding motility-associated-like protein